MRVPLVHFSSLNNTTHDLTKARLGFWMLVPLLLYILPPHHRHPTHRLAIRDGDRTGAAWGKRTGPTGWQPTELGGWDEWRDGRERAARAWERSDENRTCPFFAYSGAAPPPSLPLAVAFVYLDCIFRLHYVLVEFLCRRRIITDAQNLRALFA